MKTIVAVIVILGLTISPCQSYSEWNPTEMKEDVVDMRNHQKPTTPQQLLSKAAGVPWKEQEDHGTAQNAYGDITEHYNDLTNNQGDGSDANLVENANLTVNEQEEPKPEIDPTDPAVVYNTPNRISCGVGMDVHGLVCKLVFSDYVGVEVVCTCKDACKANGMGPECSKFWAHELQALVEEETGCTDYTAQLSVPGYWAKCRPAKIVENPLAPEVKNGPAVDKAGGAVYGGGGYGVVASKVSRKDKAMAMIQKTNVKKEKKNSIELMQRQIDQLKAEKEALEKEKQGLLSDKMKLTDEIKDLTLANSKMMEHVEAYKFDAAKMMTNDATSVSQAAQQMVQNYRPQ